MLNVDRKSRLNRAFILGFVSTILGAASHSFAGAQLPNLIAFIAATLFSVTFVLPLIKKRPSLPATLVSVSISQFLYHGLFSYFPSDLSLAGSFDPHALHRPVTFDMSGIAATSMVDAAMLTAHVIAGIVTVMLLFLGERAFEGLINLRNALEGIFRRLWMLPQPATDHRCKSIRTRFFLPNQIFVTQRYYSTVTVRGPPEPSLIST